MNRFQFNPGPAELLILVVVGMLIFSLKARRKRSSDSIFRALGVTAAVLVAMLLAGVMFYGSVRQERTVMVSPPVAQASSTSRVLTMANQPSVVSPTVVVQRSADGARSVSVSTTTVSNDGEMLMLPLSNQVLIEIIGEEGVRAIEALNESVPSELKQAYAMIPISGPGTVAPVLRNTVAPVMIQHGLSDKGLNLIQTAVGGLLASTKPAENGLTAEAGEQPEYVAPDWVNNPDDGYIVLKTEFTEPSTTSKEALRPTIEEALQQRVSDLVTEKFGTDSGWSKLLDVSVTDAAIDECVIDTSVETTILETSVGEVPMRRTYALVDLPDTLQDGLANEVRNSLQHNRMTAVCVTIGILWLCAMLLSFVFRAGQSQSVLRKLATLPMIGLLVIPCMIIFIAMTGAMLNGETFDFEWSKDRVTCVVDHSAK